MKTNYLQFVQNEINNPDWKPYPTSTPTETVHFRHSDICESIHYQFNVTTKAINVFELFRDPMKITHWYPFLYGVEKQNNEYIGMLLSPMAKVFTPFTFKYYIVEENTSFAVVFQGSPSIYLLLKDNGNESNIHIVYTAQSTANEIYCSIVMIAQSIKYFFEKEKEYLQLVEMENVAYPRYNDKPLTKYIHENQRVRITSNDSGNEIFVQADIKVPLRPNTFKEIICNKLTKTSIVTDMMKIKEGELLTYSHYHFSPLIQPIVTMDIVRGMRITDEWSAMIFKSTKTEECMHDHSNPISFKESVITWRKCDEDDTRARFSLVLNIAIVNELPIHLKDKFLSNLVAPILYFFASLSSLSSIITNLTSKEDESPEMATIESMSTLLLNAITLSKTKQKQLTTLSSLPETILLKIFSYIDVESIKNVQLLNKSFFSLINGNMTTEMWKGIFNSACYFPPNVHVERTKEKLMEIAQIQSDWKNTEFQPKTKKCGTKGITCFDINGEIYCGNECGETYQIAKKSYQTYYYKKEECSVCGIKRIDNQLYIGYTNGYVDIIRDNTYTNHLSTLGSLKEMNKRMSLYDYYKEEDMEMKNDIINTYDNNYLNNNSNTLQNNRIMTQSNSHITFTYDGKYSVNWGNKMTVTDLEHQSLLETYDHHAGDITCVCEMNDFLISGGMDKSINIVDRRIQNVSMELKGQSNAVRGVDVVGDWQIVSCGDEKAAILWDVRMGKAIQKTDLAVVPTCMTSYNKKIVCCGTNCQIVLLWNKISFGNRRYVFKVQSVPTCVAMDDECLVVGTNTGTLFFASFD